MIEVLEDTGNCKKCGTEAILGDGLCITCWDDKHGTYYNKRNIEVNCSDCGKKIYRSKKELKENNYCRNCTNLRNLSINKVCLLCGGVHTKKHGLYNNIQVYWCNDCKKNFYPEPIIKDKSKNESCPYCKTNNTVRNGHHKKRQMWKCNDCNRVFIPDNLLVRQAYNRDRIRVRCKYCFSTKVRRNGYKDSEIIIRCMDCGKRSYITKDRLL